MDIISTLQPGAVIFILVGVTFLGGAIGSFLNVVIYRLPVGQSLIRPPSHCPRCEHPIRPYDNIPVFGWLLLRGKCRDCGEPISARYPVIEAIVAVMFLVVVWVEWFGLKSPWAFPMNAVAANPDLATAGSGPSFLLVAVRTVAHLVLLVTLLGAGMIEWDQKRVPRSIWYPAIVTSVSWWLILMVLGRAGMSELFLASVIAGVGVGGFIFLIDKLRIKVHDFPVHYRLYFLSFLCIGLALTGGGVILVGVIYLLVPLVEFILHCVGLWTHRPMQASKPVPRNLCFWLISLGCVVYFYYHVPAVRFL